MVKVEDMEVVYHLARANKRGSEDAVDFEVHWEVGIRRLVEAVNNREYRCDRNYTFISLRPKPREVFGCEMETRLIQWYVVWRILPLTEEVLTARTYNNRVGMGTDAAIRRVREDFVEVSERFTRKAYYIQWDLQGYFPNADCDIVCEQLQRLVCERYDGEDKEDLLWMIMIAVHAKPQRHCYRKSPIDMWSVIERGKSLFEKVDGTGGAIGFLIWQIAMNLYLNDVDHWVVDEMGIRYVRFVDDCVMTVRNKEMALLLLPMIRERYAAFGVRMHPRKFQCQEVCKGIHFLGSYIKGERVYAHNRVLRNAAARIRLFNRTVNKEKALQKFLASVNSSLGLLKSGERCEYKSAMWLVGLIDKDWFRYVRYDAERGCLVARSGHYFNLNMKAVFNQLTNY